jgi:hypothetical protein
MVTLSHAHWPQACLPLAGRVQIVIHTIVHPGGGGH